MNLCKNHIFLFLILFFVGLSFDIFSQNSFHNTDDRIRVMFYNCENLFDTYDDSVKRDDEFLPHGDKNWSNKRYQTKLNNIYKTIIAVGEWNPPDIIGLCEVENRKVLDDLNKTTPLSRIGYEIVHYESPDRRGIDVALFYNPDKFQYLESNAIPINFPNEPNRKTRDILHVKGMISDFDTLHVFINHWPSRWGGQLESEPSRIFVANVLRKQVDSIFDSNEKSNIIITGDFNDEPEDISLVEHLKANNTLEQPEYGKLYNLSYYLKNTKNLGSHKYRNEWGVLDQMIVSGSLLSGKRNVYTTIENTTIYKVDFLIEEDKSYLGVKPFRTYTGFTFNNGFSDHLPVYIDLFFKK